MGPLVGGAPATLAPARLVQANISILERYTLLYSESLILPGVMFAPLQWAGVHPVMIYNLVVASGMVFSGHGRRAPRARVDRRWLRCGVRGYRICLSSISVRSLRALAASADAVDPMALWALHRMVRSGRTADAVLLGVFCAFELLSCVYFGLMLFPFIAVVAIVIVGAYIRISMTREEFSASVNRPFVVHAVKSMLLAIAVFGLLAAPLGIAYVRASRIVGERGAAEAMGGSAVPSDYLAAPRINLLYAKATENLEDPSAGCFRA